MKLRSYSIERPRSLWKRIAAVILLCAVLASLIAAFMVKQAYNTGLKPASASQRAVVVVIAPGSTVQQIAENLQKQGLIKSSWAFQWYVRVHNIGQYLQAGTYSLRSNQGAIGIIDTITNGKVDTSLVKILPGKRLDQIRASFITNGGFSAEEVDKALDPQLYADHPVLADKPAGATLEGYLYPDSYQKTASTKPEIIVRAALDQMQKHLSDDVKAGFKAQGLTMHQGVILASIVEQEVSNPADKATVAQVFLTRYKQGMQLGSDVTAFYGALKAGAEPLVTFDSDYNTRLHGGLPPGPISNVSDVSLRAVAHPANTDYLYFVAGDDGKTYFSHTNAEHEALTAQHCKTLCQ